MNKRFWMPVTAVVLTAVFLVLSVVSWAASSLYTMEFEYTETAFISYGGIFVMSAEDYNESNYSEISEEAENTLEYYSDAEKNETTSFNYYSRYGLLKLQNKKAPEGTPLKVIGYSDLYANTQQGYVNAGLGNIPVVGVKDTEYAATYTIVPQKGDTEYYIYVYTEDDETAPNLKYYVIDSYEKHNAFAEDAANRNYSAALSGLVFEKVEVSEDLNLDGADTGTWWRATFSLENWKHEWYGYVLSCSNSSKTASSAEADQIKKNDGSAGSIGNGWTGSGLELNSGGGSSNKTYYYNIWSVHDANYDSLLTFVVGDGNTKLGPICKKADLTIKNQTTEQGSVSVYNIFGESLAANGEATIVAPLRLKTTANEGYEGYTFRMDGCTYNSTNDVWELDFRSSMTKQVSWIVKHNLPTIKVEYALDNTEEYVAIEDLDFYMVSQGHINTKRPQEVNYRITVLFPENCEVSGLDFTLIGEAASEFGSGTLTAEDNSLKFSANWDAVEVKLVANVNGTTETVTITDTKSSGGGVIAHIGEKDYYYLEDALYDAQSGDVIVVVGNCGFLTGIGNQKWKEDANGDGGMDGYTIKDGVTLLLPYARQKTSIGTVTKTDAQNGSTMIHANIYLTKGSGKNTTAMDPMNEVYLTMTVPQGVTLNILGGGRFVIGGKIRGGTDSNAGVTGATEGSHSNVILDGTIHLKDSALLQSGDNKPSAVLSVCGYILKGENKTGNVIVESGHQVYQPFIIMDHLSGSYMVATKEVTVPFKRYAMLNIQSDIVINTGAQMYGYADIYTGAVTITMMGSIPAQHNVSSPMIIGDTDDNTLIKLSQAEGTKLTITYDEDKFVSDIDNNTALLYERVGRTTLFFQGGAELGSMDLTVTVSGISQSAKTKDTTFPVPYNYNIVLAEGKYGIGYRMQLMPGAEMTVAETAQLEVKGEQFLVVDGYRDHTYYKENSNTTSWYRGHYPRSSSLTNAPFNGSAAATLKVNGVLTIAAGCNFGGVVQTDMTSGTDCKIVMQGDSVATSQLGLYSYGDYSGRVDLTVRARLLDAGTGEFVDMVKGQTYYPAAGQGMIEQIKYVLHYKTSAENYEHTPEMLLDVNAPVVGAWYSYEATVHTYHGSDLVESNTVQFMQGADVSHYFADDTFTKFADKVTQNGHVFYHNLVVNDPTATVSKDGVVLGKYDSLEAAVKAAQSGEVVQLLKDTTETAILIAKGKQITIDLNGKKVTFALNGFVNEGDTTLLLNGATITTGKIAVLNAASGNMTIVGSGSADGNKIISSNEAGTSTGTTSYITENLAATIRNYGELTMKNITVDFNNAAYSAGVVNKGHITMLSGLIVGTQQETYANTYGLYNLSGVVDNFNSGAVYGYYGIYTAGIDAENKGHIGNIGNNGGKLDIQGNYRGVYINKYAVVNYIAPYGSTVNIVGGASSVGIALYSNAEVLQIGAGGTLNINTTSYGIYVRGTGASDASYVDIIGNGGKINITNASCGIYIGTDTYYGNVNKIATDGAVINITHDAPTGGTYGIRIHKNGFCNVIGEDGTINITIGDNAVSNSYGIYVYGKLHTLGGANSIINIHVGKTTGYNSYGILMRTQKDFHVVGATGSKITITGVTPDDVTKEDGTVTDVTFRGFYIYSGAVLDHMAETEAVITIKEVDVNGNVQRVDGSAIWVYSSGQIGTLGAGGTINLNTYYGIRVECEDAKASPHIGTIAEEGIINIDAYFGVRIIGYSSSYKASVDKIAGHGSINIVTDYSGIQLDKDAQVNLIGDTDSEITIVANANTSAAARAIQNSGTINTIGSDGSTLTITTYASESTHSYGIMVPANGKILNLGNGRSTINIYGVSYDSSHYLRGIYVYDKGKIENITNAGSILNVQELVVENDVVVKKPLYGIGIYVNYEGIVNNIGNGGSVNLIGKYGLYIGNTSSAADNVHTTVDVIGNGGEIDITANYGIYLTGYSAAKLTNIDTIGKRGTITINADICGISIMGRTNITSIATESGTIDITISGSVNEEIASSGSGIYIQNTAKVSNLGHGGTIKVKAYKGITVFGNSGTNTTPLIGNGGLIKIDAVYGIHVSANEGYKATVTELGKYGVIDITAESYGIYVGALGTITTVGHYDADSETRNTILIAGKDSTDAVKTKASYGVYVDKSGTITSLGGGLTVYANNGVYVGGASGTKGTLNTIGASNCDFDLYVKNAGVYVASQYTTVTTIGASKSDISIYASGDKVTFYGIYNIGACNVIADVDSKLYIYAEANSKLCYGIYILQKETKTVGAAGSEITIEGKSSTSSNYFRGIYVAKKGSIANLGAAGSSITITELNDTMYGNAICVSYNGKITNLGNGGILTFTAKYPIYINATTESTQNTQVGTIGNGGKLTLTGTYAIYLRNLDNEDAPYGVSVGTIGGAGSQIIIDASSVGIYLSAAKSDSKVVGTVTAGKIAADGSVIEITTTNYGIYLYKASVDVIGEGKSQIDITQTAAGGSDIYYSGIRLYSSAAVGNVGGKINISATAYYGIILHSYSTVQQMGTDGSYIVSNAAQYGLHVAVGSEVATLGSTSCHVEFSSNRYGISASGTIGIIRNGVIARSKNTGTSYAALYLGPSGVVHLAGGNFRHDSGKKDYAIVISSGGSLTYEDCYELSGSTRTVTLNDGSKKEFYYVDSAHIWNGDCICDVCEIVRFYATNVNLGNDLDMMFAFPTTVFGNKTAEELAEYYALFVLENGTVQKLMFADWQKMTIAGGNSPEYYVVSFSFAAKEMADVVTVTICDGDGNAVSISKSDSIQAYAARMLSKNSTSEQLKNVIISMLNYGSACQVQFDYHTNDLANSVLDASDRKEYVVKNGNDITVDPAGDFSIAAHNLVVNSNIEFCIALNGVKAGDTVTVSFKGHKGNDESYGAVVNDKGYIVVTGLVVADYQQTITITYGEDSKTTSIQNYLANMGADETNNAFYAFGEFAKEAYAYQHPKEVSA